MNEVKRDKATRIILNRRCGDKEADNDDVALEVGWEGFDELPNGIYQTMQKYYEVHLQR